MLIGELFGGRGDDKHGESILDIGIALDFLLPISQLPSHIIESDATVVKDFRDGESPLDRVLDLIRHEHGDHIDVRVELLPESHRLSILGEGGNFFLKQVETLTSPLASRLSIIEGMTHAAS
jgi:hypothetical protein